ncbi:hypothetical protein LCGC14_2652080, partial [marine sediment metagenome]
MNSPIKVKGALRRLHFGPGPHPSGSPQSVHAGDGVGFDEGLEDLARTMKQTGRIRKDERIWRFIEGEMKARLGGRSVTLSKEIIDRMSNVIGFVIRDDSGVELTVQMGESSNFSQHGDSEIILNWIDANQKGTGMGSAYMEAMKRLSETKGMSFRVVNVTNSKFYKRFGWLEDLNSFPDEFLYNLYVPFVPRAENDISDDSEEYDLTVSPHSPASKEWPPVRDKASVARHGKHVGQKGVSGKAGGSQPGFAHAKEWKDKALAYANRLRHPGKKSYALALIDVFEANAIGEYPPSPDVEQFQEVKFKKGGAHGQTHGRRVPSFSAFDKIWRDLSEMAPPSGSAIQRHLGPGDHPSGSPQSVHAGDGTRVVPE